MSYVISLFDVRHRVSEKILMSVFVKFKSLEHRQCVYVITMLDSIFERPLDWSYK